MCSFDTWSPSSLGLVYNASITTGSGEFLSSTGATFNWLTGEFILLFIIRMSAGVM